MTPFADGSYFVDRLLPSNDLSRCSSITDPVAMCDYEQLSTNKKHHDTEHSEVLFYP